MNKFLLKIIIFIGRILFSSKEKNVKIKKILVTLPIGIGDVLMCTPAIRALRKKFKKAQIDCLCHEWSKEVLEGNKNIDNILVENRIYCTHNPFLLYKIARKYRGYDCAVVFSYLTLPLFAYFCKIPIRVGLDKIGEGFALTRKARYRGKMHVLDHFLDVVSLLGARTTDKRMEIIFGKKKLFRRKPIAVCVGGGRNPGSNLLEKRWSKEGFAYVCNKLMEKYDIIFLGGKDDIERTNDVIKMLSKKNFKSYVGKTSLKKTANLLWNSRLLLCNDSALMHMAAAVGTKTVSIFGPTKAEILAPRGKEHVYIKAELGCEFDFGCTIAKKCNKGIETINKEVVLKTILNQLSL